jgi:hypothetical protein
MLPVGLTTLPHKMDFDRRQRAANTALGNLLLEGQSHPANSIKASKLLDKSSPTVAIKVKATEGEGRNSIVLPIGMEQKVQAGGCVYYIDHMSRTTTWSDPREKSNRGVETKGASEAEAELQTLCSAVLPEQVCLKR